MNISKADYKPSLTLSGSKSIEDTNKLTNQSGGDATINDVDPFTTSIKLEQTILDFGRDITLQKNITALDLAKAKLVKKEQDILHKAIDAFMNLILSRETLNINSKNLNRVFKVLELVKSFKLSKLEDNLKINDLNSRLNLFKLDKY